MFREVAIEMVSYIGYLSMWLLVIGLVFGLALIVDDVLQTKKGGVR